MLVGSCQIRKFAAASLFLLCIVSVTQCADPPPVSPNDANDLGTPLNGSHRYATEELEPELANSIFNAVGKNPLERTTANPVVPRVRGRRSPANDGAFVDISKIVVRPAVIRHPDDYDQITSDFILDEETLIEPVKPSSQTGPLVEKALVVNIEHHEGDDLPSEGASSQASELTTTATTSTTPLAVTTASPATPASSTVNASAAEVTTASTTTTSTSAAPTTASTAESKPSENTKILELLQRDDDHAIAQLLNDNAATNMTAAVEPSTIATASSVLTNVTASQAGLGTTATTTANPQPTTTRPPRTTEPTVQLVDETLFAEQKESLSGNDIGQSAREESNDVESSRTADADTASKVVNFGTEALPTNNTPQFRSEGISGQRWGYTRHILDGTVQKRRSLVSNFIDAAALRRLAAVQRGRAKRASVVDTDVETTATTSETASVVTKRRVEDLPMRRGIVTGVVRSGRTRPASTTTSSAESTFEGNMTETDVATTTTAEEHTLPVAGDETTAAEVVDASAEHTTAKPLPRHVQLRYQETDSREVVDRFSLKVVPKLVPVSTTTVRPKTTTGNDALSAEYGEGADGDERKDGKNTTKSKKEPEELRKRDELSPSSDDIESEKKASRTSQEQPTRVASREATSAERVVPQQRTISQDLPIPPAQENHFLVGNRRVVIKSYPFEQYPWSVDPHALVAQRLVAAQQQQQQFAAFNPQQFQFQRQTPLPPFRTAPPPFAQFRQQPQLAPQFVQQPPTAFQQVPFGQRIPVPQVPRSLNTPAPPQQWNGVAPPAQQPHVPAHQVPLTAQPRVPGPVRINPVGTVDRTVPRAPTTIATTTVETTTPLPDIISTPQNKAESRVNVDTDLDLYDELDNTRKPSKPTTKLAKPDGQSFARDSPDYEAGAVAAAKVIKTAKSDDGDVDLVTTETNTWKPDLKLVTLGRTAGVTETPTNEFSDRSEPRSKFNPSVVKRLGLIQG